MNDTDDGTKAVIASLNFSGKDGYLKLICISAKNKKLNFRIKINVLLNKVILDH